MNQPAIIGILLFATFVVSSTPTTALGQSPVNSGDGTANPDPNTVYGYSGYGSGAYGLGYGVGSGYGLGYGVTPTRLPTDTMGMKNLVRTEGENKQQTTQSLINEHKKARKRSLDDQQKAVTERQMARRQIPSKEATHREVAVQEPAEQFVDTHKPQPLTDSQLDPTTGQIHWPAALTLKDFESLRTPLDRSFRARSKTTRRTAVLSSQIERQVKDLKDALRACILEIPFSDYSEARHFLDSMAVSGN